MGLDVVELFAGVGGFHLGLRDAGHRIVWWNQWEPGKKKQHAHACYVKHFPEEAAFPNTNRDICEVDAADIPRHDLLVGGFPCQDYSVAQPLRRAKGIKGKKGVLWWEINRILEHHQPRFILLENVDRLLTAYGRHTHRRAGRVKRRGRDFGVLLSCLRRLGYRVEWRVINAADYGAPQRRRRIFIFGAHESTRAGQYMANHARDPTYLTKTGFFAAPFPVRQEAVLESVEREPEKTRVPSNPKLASDSFKFEFRNAGLMVDGKLWTSKLYAVRDQAAAVMRSCLEENVGEEYYVPEKDWKAWEDAKDAKEVPKLARGKHEYIYKEGKMAFPDPFDEPARTLLTGEGGLGPSRSNHILRDPWTKRLRILTPLECERLNGFEDSWTEGMPRRWRYFTMGNALVVPIIRRMAERLNSFTDAPASSSAEVATVTDARQV
ncbi:MAG: DNA (cytosine-5-)-methyltransferase [Thermoplasmatota archaeon]